MSRIYLIEVALEGAVPATVDLVSGKPLKYVQEFELYERQTHKYRPPARARIVLKNGQKLSKYTDYLVLWEQGYYVFGYTRDELMKNYRKHLQEIESKNNDVFSEILGG